jgi:hypothetical protein
MGLKRLADVNLFAADLVSHGPPFGRMAKEILPLQNNKPFCAGSSWRAAAA